MNLKKIKFFMNGCLSKYGLEIKRIGNPINLWDFDEGFNDLYGQVRGRTLVDKKRCFMLYQFAKQVIRVPGDIAEVGVYKGGTAKLLAKVGEASNKTIHLFDTFAGMPATDAKLDIHQEGDFNDTSFDAVRTFLNEDKNVRIYQGLFPETARPIENSQFAFVHIDVDIYRSVIDCCCFFYQRLSKNGILIFDDYGFLSCAGAKKAVDEFFRDKPEMPCYLPTGQVVVIKI